MLFGLAVFIAFYVQTDGQLRQQRELRLEQRAQDAASEVERNVARHQEALEGVSSFFESSEKVNAEEFRVFTAATLERFPNLQAISWNPIVSEGELADFEAMQQEEQGFDGFIVTERDENGDLIPVLARPEYVAVQYIEPVETNASALGFDINSNPSRAVAIEQTRQSGESTATEPIELVQETGTQLGMLALVPVYSIDEATGEIDRAPEELRGFAVGVYRLGDLLTDTFVGAQWNKIDVRLVDVTEPDESQIVGERFSTNPASQDLTRSAPDYVPSEPFTVYGRDWRVEVLPTSGPLAAPNQGLPLAVDVFGLVMLTLLQALLLLLTGKERSAVRKAETATEEASTDPLTGLSNRRAFLRDLEQARRTSMADESTSVLLYLDLDGFKAVNDRGGHLAGDDLLERIGSRLKDSVRGHDAVARLGGDEFAVILNQCNLDQGIVVAEKLVAAVENASVDSDAGALTVGVSIGLTAMTPEDGFSVDELIKQADDACYEAKHNGGGIRMANVAPSA